MAGTFDVEAKGSGSVCLAAAAQCSGCCCPLTNSCFPPKFFSPQCWLYMLMVTVFCVVMSVCEHGVLRVSRPMSGH